VVKKFNLKNRTEFFLNLPYFENEFEIDSINDQRFFALQEELEQGSKLIMHQGSLEEERGRKRLADFSKMDPEKYKILIVGVDEEKFNSFIKEYELNLSKFYFFGIVRYDLLDNVWEKCHASIVMYLPTYINNKLCAPNRLYISLKHGLPVIVNKDNPVLNKIISDFKCGYFIEEFVPGDFELLKKRNVFTQYLTELKKENTDKFVKLYRD